MFSNLASPDLLLIFKFTVTPILVGLASLAARRWGNTVAGLITGFPLMTAPISIFLTIEQGAEFTVSASIGILIALVGIAVYALAYVVAARFVAWPFAITYAYAAFFAASWLVAPYITTHFTAALAAYLAIIISIVLMPRNRSGGAPLQVPIWEIWLRMFSTAAMIALVTSIASMLGPTWTGIIATIPVMATIMVTFTHGRFGHRPATVFMRSMMLSMFSFATFFVVVAYALQYLDPLHAYVLATAIAVALSPIVVRIDRAVSS